MPFWKTTENIICPEKSGEFFDENWMNYDHIWQYAPKPIPWKEKRQIAFEDVDLWEVIIESSYNSSFIGVYAAWQPYEEYYVVIANWSIYKEFVGIDANKRLEDFLVRHNVYYPKTNDNKNIKNKSFLEKTIIDLNM